MSKIAVYVIPSGKETKVDQRLIFSDSSTFDVIPMEDGLCPPEIAESCYVTLALRDASTKYPAQPVLIVKDNTLSLVTGTDLSNAVKAIIQAAERYDLIYLDRWQDDCAWFLADPNKTRRMLPEGIVPPGLAVSQSFYPQGLQAVIYSPAVRSKVLSMQPGTDLSTTLRDSARNGGTILAKGVNYSILFTVDQPRACIVGESPLGPVPLGETITRETSVNGWAVAFVITLIILIVVVIVFAVMYRSRIAPYRVTTVPPTTM